MENTGYIKDLDCTKDTPVIYGHEDAPIYGQGIRIKSRVPGRQDSEHMKKIYLEELLPPGRVRHDRGVTVRRKRQYSLLLQTH